MVTLWEKKLGENAPVYIICEGGVTNYGDLKLAKKQIDAAVDAKADAIKFQVWKTENLVSKKVSARLEKELGYDWFSRMKSKELSFDDLRRLFEYARGRGIEIFASAHDNESLEFLADELRQPFFKIGSGEAHNLEFLKQVGAKRKPVIISFGLQSDEEAKHAVATLLNTGVPSIIALHCITMYPTPYEYILLDRMQRLQNILDVPTGLSDHSRGMHIALAAVALGATVIEKHLTFDKDDPRSLDNAGALLPEEFKVMVSHIRDIEAAMREVDPEERAQLLLKNRDWAGQSIMAARDLEPGTVITQNAVVFKRPAKGGLPPAALESIIGKRVRVMVKADEQIQLEFLEV